MSSFVIKLLICLIWILRDFRVSSIYHVTLRLLDVFVNTTLIRKKNHNITLSAQIIYHFYVITHSFKFGFAWYRILKKSVIFGFYDCISYNITFIYENIKFKCISFISYVNNCYYEVNSVYINVCQTQIKIYARRFRQRRQ